MGAAGVPPGRYAPIMITRFGDDAALLLIDVQRGVDVLEYWGGPTGRRNNPGAEAAMSTLLEAWRSTGRPVAFTRHDSREASSPLRFSLPTGDQKPGFEPRRGEIVVDKDVNSGFVHSMTVANLHGEFCTVIHATDGLGLLAGDDAALQRRQGNE